MVLSFWRVAGNRALILSVLAAVFWALASLALDAAPAGAATTADLGRPAADSLEGTLYVTGAAGGTRVPCPRTTKSVVVRGSPDAGRVYVGGSRVSQVVAGPVILDKDQSTALAQTEVHVVCASGTDAGCRAVTYLCQQ